MSNYKTAIYYRSMRIVSTLQLILRSVMSVARNTRISRVCAIISDLYIMQMVRLTCAIFVQPSLSGLEPLSNTSKRFMKESGSSRVQHVVKSSSVNPNSTVTYESMGQMHQSVSHVLCVIKDFGLKTTMSAT